MIHTNPPLNTLSLDCCDNGARCLGPDLSRRVTEALEQSTVFRQNHSNPMVGQASFHGEALNYGEDFGLHSETIARFSVQVNARYNVNAVNAVACYPPDMENGWFTRLVEKIDADGRSKLAISLAANCGRNFVQQMIKDGKEPGSDKLARILEELGPRAALYVFTGMDLEEEDRELLALLSHMDSDAKKDAVRLLQRVKSGEAV